MRAESLFRVLYILIYFFLFWKSTFTIRLKHHYMPKWEVDGINDDKPHISFTGYRTFIGLIASFYTTLYSPNAYKLFTNISRGTNTNHLIFLTQKIASKSIAL